VVSCTGFPNFFVLQILGGTNLGPLVGDHGAQGFINSFYYSITDPWGTNLEPPLKEKSVGDHSAQCLLNSFCCYRSLVAQTLRPLKEESVGDHGEHGFINSFHYYRSLVAQTLSPLKEDCVGDHVAQGFLNSFHYYRSFVARTLSPRRPEAVVILLERGEGLQLARLAAQSVISQLGEGDRLALLALGNAACFNFLIFFL
jgi:hypothetical protein